MRELKELKAPELEVRTGLYSLGTVQTSVADPNLDPDPHVFGPPGSGSGFIRQRYGSGSFYYYAKIVRKTLISTVL